MALNLRVLWGPHLAAEMTARNCLPLRQAEVIFWAARSPPGIETVLRAREVVWP